MHDKATTYVVSLAVNCSFPQLFSFLAEASAAETWCYARLSSLMSHKWGALRRRPWLLFYMLILASITSYNDLIGPQWCKQWRSIIYWARVVNSLCYLCTCVGFERMCVKNVLTAMIFTIKLTASFVVPSCFFSYLRPKQIKSCSINCVWRPPRSPLVIRTHCEECSAVCPSLSFRPQKRVNMQLGGVKVSRFSPDSGS